MKKTGSGDLRVQKTLMAIDDAFEKLMLEMPYRKVTVTALCQQARINKKTFYRYYTTLDELLRDIVNRFGAAYIERTQGLYYPDDVDKITREFLNFSAEQGPFYDAIVCKCIHEPVFSELMTEIEHERYAVSLPPEGWTPDEWNLYMKGVTHLQWNVYRQWVLDGRSVPLERMVEIACNLLVKGATLK